MELSGYGRSSIIFARENMRETSLWRPSSIRGSRH